MRNSVSILLLILSISNSCGNNSQKITSARSFYNSIQKEYSSNKIIQEQFLDSLAKIGLYMQINPAAKIDTNSFKQYIESAKLKNIQTISNIEKISEVDEKINYKSKVLTHLISINNIYDSGLQEFIKILNQDNKEKYSQAAKFLMPKLKLLDQTGKEYEVAKDIFHSKYDIDPE